MLRMTPPFAGGRLTLPQTFSKKFRKALDNGGEVCYNPFVT